MMAEAESERGPHHGMALGTALRSGVEPAGAAGIRKGQVRWLSEGDVAGQVLLIHSDLRIESCVTELTKN
jgi:hypothetical protein